MPGDDPRRDLTREIRIEGVGLWLAGAALVALLAAAFAAGRIVERRAPRPGAGGGADPLSGLSSEPEAAPEKVTFFDTVQGQGKEAEPRREAAGAARSTAAPPAAAPQPGPWFVQVFVGRDRAAAEEVVRGLTAKGYPVTTSAVPEGASGSLFKVRVGGYATRDAAEGAAQKLHQDGEGSTWVVRVGS